jgi:hypothetical protein
MPLIQKLHDRYRERGLTVVALSYEQPEEMQPFLAKMAYTMPVASDPEKKTVTAYKVEGWPTSVIIDKQGKVAHIGSPYNAEAFVEKALGLETDPATLLNAWLDSLGDPGPTRQRECLQRLLEKATDDFDLQAWAKGHMAPGTAAPEGASPPMDGADLLRRCAETWAAGDRAALMQLATAGPTKFDLAAFAKGEFAKAYPFDEAELKTLLQEKSYAAVLEAIEQRLPTEPVLVAAGKDQALVTFCRSQIANACGMAKKGLMAHLWIFPGTKLKDEEGFWRELSISGVMRGPDRNSIVGVVLGGEMVFREQAESYVTRQLKQAILMENLATGKLTGFDDLATLIGQERTAIVHDLESRYGKPEPHDTK